MNRSNHYLKDIVEIAKDGAQFYDDAQQHVQDVGLRSIFTQMAAAKRDLIAGLSAQLRADGEQRPRSGTIAGAIRKTYTDVAAKLSKHEAKLYIAQLEETEDRLIGEVRKAIAECDDANARSVLEAYWPKVKSSHDQMRNLKHSMAA